MSELLRAICYARVSSDAQAREDRYSIPYQLRVTEGYCRQVGAVVVDRVTDDFTGFVMQRPGFERIREAAQAGTFDLLVVTELDRFSRDDVLGRAELDALSELGVEVHFVQQRFDDTEEGELARSVVWTAQKYVARALRAKTMRGRWAKAGADRVPSSYGKHGAPFGYKLVTRAMAEAVPEYHGRSGEWELIPAEAELIRQMYELLDQHGSMMLVLRWLNGLDLPEAERPRHPNREGTPWHYSSVRAILSAEIYLGEVVYGRRITRMTKQVGTNGNPIYKHTPRPAGQEARISIPPIVEPDLWERCQEKREEAGTRFHGRPTRVWLLKGVVVCAHCRTKNDTPYSCTGSRSSRKKGTACYEQRRYRCNSHTRHQPPYCPVKHEALDLERQALEFIEDALRPGEMERIALAAYHREQEAARRSQDELPDLEARLRTVQAKERRLLDLDMEGLYSREVIQEKMAPIQRERLQIERRLQELQRHREREVDLILIRDRARVLADEARAKVEAGKDDPKQLQEVYQRLLRVTLFRDEPPLFSLVIAGLW